MLDACTNVRMYKSIRKIIFYLFIYLFIYYKYYNICIIKYALINLYIVYYIIYYTNITY